MAGKAAKLIHWDLYSEYPEPKYSNNTTRDPHQVTCPVCIESLYEKGILITVGERSKRFQEAQDMIYNLNAQPGWEP